MLDEAQAILAKITARNSPCKLNLPLEPRASNRYRYSNGYRYRYSVDTWICIRILVFWSIPVGSVPTDTAFQKVSVSEYRYCTLHFYPDINNVFVSVFVIIFIDVGLDASLDELEDEALSRRMRMDTKRIRFCGGDSRR